MRGNDKQEFAHTLQVLVRMGDMARMMGATGQKQSKNPQLLFYLRLKYQLKLIELR